MRALSLLAMFMPVFGLLATIACGRVLKGATRFLALFLVPFAFLLLCGACSSAVGANDGNIFFFPLYIPYVIGLCMYYPVLLIVFLVWILTRSRKNKERQKNSQPTNSPYPDTAAPDGTSDQVR